MIISKIYVSEAARELIGNDELANTAFIEVKTSIQQNSTEGYEYFVINNHEKIVTE